MISFLSLLLAVFASAAVKNPDMFVVAQVDEATSLDPAFPYDNASQNAIYNVYETLIAFDGPALDRFVPRLAVAVPSLENGLISADGLTYRFPIRKGVKFHDGTEMTAHDARYGLLRFMLTDRAGGPSALLLEPILGLSSTRDSSGAIVLDFARVEKAVRVEGDSVVITLARPFAPFLAIMARWSYVMPRAWAAKNGEWDGTAETWKQYNNPDKGSSYFHEHANGTGPFRVERWDKTARFILLARNDAYWRRPARLKRVLIKTVPEFNTRRLMLAAGDADMIDTPRPFVAQLENLPGVKIADRLPRLATDPVFFFTFDINMAGNPDVGSGQFDGEGIPSDFFTDSDLRKGFAFAFDYDALVNDTFKKTAKRALGPVPPGIPGYDPHQPHYSFDKAAAEAHFRRAWGGKVWQKGFKFTLTFNTGSENRQAACQILKKGVESLNPKFKVDVRGVEWASYLDKAQRRLMPMFSRGWYGDYPDAHNFVYAFYHSQGRYPSAQGYKNAELDKLVEAAVREPDAPKRRKLYREILRLGREEVPAIVTVHPVGVYALRQWVRGFYDNPVLLGPYFYAFSKD